MTKEDISITYENNVFYCTKNGTKWISVDGEKWYGEEKRIIDLEKEKRLLGERCNQLLKDKGELTDKIADIKANCDLAIEGRDVKIVDLEETIANLKEQVQSQVEATIELDKKNAELKADNDARKYAMAMSEKVEKQLREQIEKMKNCYNCKGYYTKQCVGCEDYCNWELKE